MNSKLKQTVVASAVALALGAPVVANAALVENVFGAYTWSTDRANFTMLDDGGGVTGGTNDVAMNWDGNAYTDSSDYTGPGIAGNVTAASTTVFNNHLWTAHDIQVFTPGTYSFDTTLGGGNNESGIMTGTVGTNQMGMHMLFDWNGNDNIDVFVVASQSSVFGAGDVFSTNATAFGSNNCSTGVVKNCLWDGPGWVGGDPANRPMPDQVWMLASGDPDGDGIMGIQMAPGGPFAGFNANFNASMAGTPKEVPVPAAAWLFGSGLLGLVGVARRRKQNS